MRVNSNALIVHEGKVLLTKFRDVIGDYYTIPGGKVEKHENAHEAAIRECYEECGVDVKIGELLLVYEYAPKEADRERFGKKQKMGLLFRGELTSPPDRLAMIEPDKEQIGAEWVSLDRLREAAAQGKPLLYPRIESLLADLVSGKKPTPAFVSNQTG